MKLYTRFRIPTQIAFFILGLGILSYFVGIRYDMSIPYISQRGVYEAPLYEKIRGALFSIAGLDVPLTIIRAEISPVKVSVGDTQSLSISISDPTGVVSVLATTQLDSGERRVELIPAGDSNTWKGNWIVNDASHKIYRTTFMATNARGKTRSITLAWFDPCSPPLGGNWTLDGNCSFSTTEGLDAGILTIPADNVLTIQPTGKWVFNQGYPIKNNGQIIIQDGGQIKRTLLWLLDTDVDGFGSTTTKVQQDTQPPGAYVRASSVSSQGDCYDNSANAKPGQTSYFTTNRGDASYDYDCNGTEDKQYPTGGSCTPYECNPCDKGGCSTCYSSVVGWTGAVPACGAGSTYYNDTVCTSQALTQSCR